MEGGQIGLSGQNALRPVEVGLKLVLFYTFLNHSSMGLGGTKTRRRTCTQPENGGKPCSGEDEDEEPCNFQGCAVDGQWGPWSSWGSCDRSCGGGSKYKRRDCTPARNGGNPCVGQSEIRESCNLQECNSGANFGQALGCVFSLGIAQSCCRGEC